MNLELENVKLNKNLDLAIKLMDEYAEEKQELQKEITHLKNLIVTMSYDINYEDGSIMDTSIQNIRKEIL
tara:strand:- start:6426 stop:6635 length:210 start_codon:yes stop_codon:yes gene_type:complete